MDLKSEFTCVNFNDQRLNRRLDKMVSAIGDNITGSVAECMQTWKDTQGAYRFYSNENVTPEALLETHQNRTFLRMRQFQTVLLVQDTSDIMSKNLKEPAFISNEQQKGLLIHPTLAITPDRLCLGLFHFKYWHRPELNQKKGNDIEEKESYKWIEPLKKAEEFKTNDDTRWVVVGDRECDIFEFYQESKKVDFLVRTAQDRKLENGKKLFETLDQADFIGQITFHHKDHGLVVQNVSMQQVTLMPPEKHHLRKSMKPLVMTAILCKQANAKPGEDPICWRLLTSVIPHSVEEAFEIINWYTIRWEIEIFFKILKSGCGIEKTQFETVDRLANFIALFCVFAWKILYMTKLGETCGDFPATLIFTDVEWRLAYAKARLKQPPKEVPSLKEIIDCIAKLGGHLNRKHDDPPGPKIFWKGLMKLQDMCIGFLTAQEFNLNC